MLTINEARDLELEAEQNAGRCGHCHQTIKIYKYKINKVHALFMRAMADEVRNTGVNDVDLGTIALPYSMRSQNSKLRQHGLIARVKNKDGAQLARRWLITHKGWNFLNGDVIPEYVLVYNNQVLGHDGRLVSIYSVLGESFNKSQPIYAETPISQPEARIYGEARQTKKHLKIRAKFKTKYNQHFKLEEVYDLTIDRLMLGKPVKIIAPHEAEYADMAAFQKDWRIL